MPLSSGDFLAGIVASHAACERRLKSAARGARKVQRWAWF
jgi:NAD(P)H-hydrate repair Nnr-like enzyme with NAD(P)H-hydrate dehydratase domain